LLRTHPTLLLAKVTGAMLPLVLEKCGLDPAHAGPIIQVIMDVTGVFITCKVCSFMIAADTAPHSISI
jgi:Mg/Co/Ni transporter MgtE